MNGVKALMSADKQFERKDNLTGCLALAAGITLSAAVLFGSTGPEWVLNERSFIPYLNCETIYEKVFSIGLTICGTLVAVFGLDLIWLRRRDVLSATGVVFLVAGLIAMQLTAFVSGWDLQGTLVTAMVLAVLLGTVLMTVNDWMKGWIFVGGVSLVLIFTLLALLAANGVSDFWVPATYGFSAWLIIQGLKFLFK